MLLLPVILVKAHWILELQYFYQSIKLVSQTFFIFITLKRGTGIQHLDASTV